MKNNNEIIIENINKLSQSIIVRNLLNCSIGRVAKKFDAASFFEQNDTQIRHIVDWLEAAVLTNAPWLILTDDKGRPKKLMKSGSLNGLIAIADKEMNRINQKLGKITVETGDEELVHTNEDGTYIVRLLTPNALDMESLEMQHCIGQGRYDKGLETEKNKIYSVRDKYGNRHITMMTVDSKITQMVGKQNKPPISLYIPLVNEFIKINSLEIEPSALEGIVQLESGDICSIDRIPEGSTIDHNIKIRDSSLLQTLPKDLTLNGYVSVLGWTKGSPSLAPSIILNREIDIFCFTEDFDIELPEIFYHNVKLFGIRRNVEKDYNIKIAKGNLNLDMCERGINELTVDINGSLFINSSNFNALKIKSKLDIFEMDGCGIEKFDENFSVSASKIKIKNCSNLLYLPKLLEADEIQISQCYKVDFSGTKLKAKKIIIDRCDCDNLPEIIDADEIIFSMLPNIKEISDISMVGKSIKLSHLPELEKISNEIAVSEYLEIHFCPSLHEFPRSMKVDNEEVVEKFIKKYEENETFVASNQELRIAEYT